MELLILEVGLAEIRCRLLENPIEHPAITFSHFEMRLCEKAKTNTGFDDLVGMHFQPRPLSFTQYWQICHTSKSS